MSDTDSNGPTNPSSCVLVRWSDKQRFPLHIGANTIGREPDSDIVLESNAVSRCHCVLVVTETGGCELRDNRSRNGTYVKRMDDPEEPQRIDRTNLASGDWILICDQWFVLEGGKSESHSREPIDPGELVSNMRSYAGGCEVLEELGRGTTGIVYKARQLRSNRVVAVKIPLPCAVDERAIKLARFRCEAETLARIAISGQANLTALFEVGEFRGQVYMSREFVEGSTLEQLVVAGSIGLREQINVLATVGKTVAYVHDCGFVHGNLRPANILVGPGNIPKLIGFGLVSLRAGAKCLAPGRSGVPAERDIWALCGLLEWLCEDVQQLLPAKLQILCGRCRDARSQCPFDTATELADALFDTLDST